MSFIKFKVQIFITLTILLLVCSTTYGQRRRVSQIKEQVSFSGEEGKIKNPVKIPKKQQKEKRLSMLIWTTCWLISRMVYNV